MSDTVDFQVDGREFCTMLTAVALFQGPARTMPEYAKVFCFVRHDGLTMGATNGVSCAVGRVDVLAGDGVGVFVIPAPQVKALLAVFDRALPKDPEDEYVLEVEVDADQIRVRDVSSLFDHEELLIAVQPEDDVLRTRTSVQQAMSLAAIMSRAVSSGIPFDLASGCYFSHAEVARLARAAKTLGTELMLRPLDGRLLAPLSEDFAAFTVAQVRDREEQKAPFLDERAVRDWRARLEELVDGGAL